MSTGNWDDGLVYPEARSFDFRPPTLDDKIPASLYIPQIMNKFRLRCGAYFNMWEPMNIHEARELVGIIPKRFVRDRNAVASPLISGEVTARRQLVFVSHGGGDDFVSS